VVLVDLTKLDFAQAEVPLLPQTRRHALLAQLLRVDHVVFAVDEIDAVAEAAADAFRRVSAALQRFCRLRRAGRGRHRAGVGPARRQRRPAHAGRLVRRPFAAGTARDAARGPRAAGRAAGAAGAALSPAKATAPAQQPRVLCGAGVARGDVAVGDTVQLFPSGESATVQALLGLDGELRRCGARRLSRPAWCSTACSMSRAATGCSRPAVCRRRARAARHTGLARHRARRARPAATRRATATAEQS
jgi:sulfate adenylyltransferase subunit 1